MIRKPSGTPQAKTRPLRSLGGNDDRSTAHPASVPDRWIPLSNVPRNLQFATRTEHDARIARNLFAEIFEQGTYTRRGFELMRNATVLDIGANMGIFSLWAANEAPQGKIIAVEPTRIFETLQYNLALNGLTHVSPVQKAIGIDGETVALDFYPSAHPGSLQVGFRNPRFTFCLGKQFPRIKRWLFPSRPAFLQPVREEAPGISLPRLLEDHGLTEVDFMKMDCEGGEFIVFQNVRARDLRPINTMVIEFHEYRADFDHRMIVALLKEAGFAVEVKRTPSLWFFKQGYIWARRRG